MLASNIEQRSNYRMPGNCAKQPLSRSNLWVGSNNWCRAGGESSGLHCLGSSTSSPHNLFLSLSMLKFADLQNGQNFLRFAIGWLWVLNELVQVKCLERNPAWLKHKIVNSYCRFLSLGLTPDTRYHVLAGDLEQVFSAPCASHSVKCVKVWNDFEH